MGICATRAYTKVYVTVSVFTPCCTSQPDSQFQTLPEEEPSSFIAECYFRLPLQLGPQLIIL